MPLRSERRFIKLSDISSGMMLNFVYTKEAGVVKEYTVLVIDPDKINESTDTHQLHGVLLDGLTDFEIIKMVTAVGDGFRFSPDDRAAPLTKMNTDKSYELYRAAYKGQNRYRTFILTKMTSVKQILIGEIE